MPLTCSAGVYNHKGCPAYDDYRQHPLTRPVGFGAAVLYIACAVYLVLDPRQPDYAVNVLASAALLGGFVAWWLARGKRVTLGPQGLVIDWANDARWLRVTIPYGEIQNVHFVKDRSLVQAKYRVVVAAGDKQFALFASVSTVRALQKFLSEGLRDKGTRIVWSEGNEKAPALAEKAVARAEESEDTEKAE